MYLRKCNCSAHLLLGSGPVNDNFEAEQASESTERLSHCKFAVEAAMHELIRELTRSGWQESEVTLILADTAEDQVLRLAARMARPQLKLV
jgi:hypothetical protein